jgi:hypothetical protein
MSNKPKKSPTPLTAPEATLSPPKATIRIGVITASIWEHPSEKGPFHVVTFDRRYRNKDGEWLTSHAYSPADLLVLSKVADLAYIRILDFQHRGDD